MERNNLLNKVDENGVKVPGSGFFSESGRVRAQKFKGIRSEGFFCPLSYLLKDDELIQLGTPLDTWNGEVICTKYETPATKRARENVQKQLASVNLLKKIFPQHVDTNQWRYYQGKTTGKLYYTEKLHGTSVRIANIKVPQKLSWWKKVVNLFGKFYETEKYDILLGTRRAILLKDKTGKYTGGFYGDGEPYSKILTPNLLNMLKEDVIVYGEIVGYVHNTPLFKQTSDKLPEIKKLYGKDIVYDYGLPKGQCELYVYRITHRGLELPWWNVKNLCKISDVKHVPEYPMGTDPYLEGPSLLSNKHPTEGYVIREELAVEDKTKVNFYKEKSFTFKVLEGIVKDSSEAVDIEEIQG
jgi:hypothetical protein